MKPYTFYLHESRRAGPSFQFIACENDDHARTHAQDLFEVFPDLVEVEIYDGRRSRFRVGRPGDGPTAQQAAAG
jgi:hypothetical protein